MIIIEEYDKYNELLNLYNSHDNIDVDVALYTNAKVQMRSGNFKVDTIYIYRDYDDNIVLKGYAHNDNGQYDWDYLTADDIVNIDISPYMNDIYVIDFEGFLNCLKENNIL